jgi:3-oxoacyl-[acyl-carrier-protein] synthase II
VFGWGIVAPKSPDIAAFKKNLESAESWLSAFEGFGPNNFLVGVPEFQFSDYQNWIEERFAPRHFQKLKEKMDWPAQYAMGSFIQALGQNPGMERELQDLAQQAHVYVGTGVGSLDTISKASIRLVEAQRRWNAFWAKPENNSARRKAGAEQDGNDEEWMARSPELAEYLADLAEIENLGIEGKIEAGKLHAIREKEKRRTKLQEKWNAPEPPWTVSADVIWNIHNTPAAQISILGKIKGLTFAPVAACSTFGVALRLAMRAIQTGDAKAVVVGATDPPPHPLLVGAFYTARVLSAAGNVSVPLTRLQGTHVAGGAVTWIVGDFDYMTAKGFRPLGMEPLGVGVSSDAEHIITPSIEGPKAAIWGALEDAGAKPENLASWDLHATATPGDFSEIATFRSIFPEPVVIAARKGTFGHGMSAGGGWELTAQYLGYEQGRLFPTPLKQDELNESIRQVHERFVFEAACDTPPGLAGKLSMGIGGINACVISRPLR